MDSIRVGTWNVGWNSSRSTHYQSAVDRIAEISADILVLTETTPELLPEGGFVARAGPDWGYETEAGRRKVVLWSKWPITDVSTEIVDPGGRHVSATIINPSGPLRIHAICVPWSHAHVSGGRKDREVWEDHFQFLESLDELLRAEIELQADQKTPLIVAGDVNQREQPRPYGSRKVREKWASLLDGASLTVATDEEMIDKIAVSQELTVKETAMFPPEKMSDHHAVSCLLEPVSWSGRRL